MTDNAKVVAPIVLDLGRVRRKHVRRLKRGRGKLIDDVREVVESVRQELGEEAADRQLLPIVLIYRKKEKRRRKAGFPLFC